MSSSRYPDDDDAFPPVPKAPEPVSSPALARRALRRLQSGPPPPFEQVIDMMYEWWECESLPATNMMRRLLSKNHNVSDETAVAEIKEFIRTARMDRISIRVAALGLDEAERILGLNEDK